ncbi:hypothetical protein [Luteimonas lutimaris]|uniref:Uncharacterized protein n=1 Tax=Luteimonas lutimaris TaxID=698645 RepID=A0ABP7M3T6_9GAMM
MEARLIAPSTVELAKLVGLVKAIEPVEVSYGKGWGLLVRGRGFARLVEKEILYSPNFIWPVERPAPVPLTFSNKTEALAYAQRSGLHPRRKAWVIESQQQ